MLLAPTYLLLGSSSAALLASAAVVNAVWAALVVIAVRHLFGPRHAWLALAAVLAVALAFGVDLFRVVWNPYAVLPPTLLFLVCCWGALLGRGRYGLASVLLGSFLVQTHIGLLPLVAVELVVVAAHRIRLPSRPDAGWLLVVAVWAPPLWNEVGGSGNLSTLGRYFLRAHDLAGWMTTFSRVDGVLGRVLLSRASDRLDRPLGDTAGWLVIAVAAACMALVVLDRRDHEPALTAAGELGGAGVVAALVAAHGIVGRADPYLLLWVAVLPVLPALAGLPVLARAAPVRVRWPTAIAIATATCAACVAGALSLPPFARLGDANVTRALAPPGTDSHLPPAPCSSASATRTRGRSPPALRSN